MTLSVHSDETNKAPYSIGNYCYLDFGYSGKFISVHGFSAKQRWRTIVNRYSYSPFESVTLFLVAQEQGFFDQNDLNLTLHKYNTGAGALSGVINGEADLVVGTTEFPLPYKH